MIQRGKSSTAQWLAYLLLDPAARGLIPSIPQKNSEEKIVDVAENNQRHCFEESGQWLENVYRTHLVMAWGMLALLKTRTIE